jgi:hypothetical protein
MSDPNLKIAAVRNDTKMLPYAFPQDGSINNQQTSIELRRYSRGNPRDPANKAEILQTVYLPLPMVGIKDNVALQYQEVPLGAIGGLLSPGRNKVAASVVEGARFVATSAVSALGDLAAGAFAARGAGRTAAAIGGLTDSAVAAGEQAAGIATNPNLSLSFQGVNLRQHDFSWRLIAKHAKDSIEIFRIIEILKRAALPQQVWGANLTFGYPCVAYLKFNPENLIKMSEYGCFIDNINVTYDGDSYPTFFKNTDKPVVVDLSISFRERAVLTASDYGDPGINLDKGGIAAGTENLVNQVGDTVSQLNPTRRP